MGRLVNVTDRASAFMQLSASIISVITCSIIVYSISLDQKTLKKSYHLRLVQRLLLSDIGLSSAIIVYYIMAASLDNTALTSYCNFHIPVVVYFFLCSFGWTAMLAYRFRSSHSQTKKLAPPPVDMWVVWTVPLLFAGVVLLTAFATDKVTTVEASSSNTNKSCTFDHDSNTGIYVDLITYQAPLLLTICVNCYSYGKGLYYLRNTPQSVLARQMKKAGGYLAVLLVIWVPNFVYNILTMFEGSDPEYNGFLDLVVFFNTLQGFLNVCVYIWGNQKMRNWLWRHLPCTSLCSGKRGNGRGGGAADSKQQFNSGSVKSPVKEQYYNSRTGNTNSGTNYNMDADEEEGDNSDEDCDDEESLTSNSHLREAAGGSSSSSSGVNNPLNSSSSSSTRITESSSGSSSSTLTGGSKTKSILIPAKNLDGKIIKSSGGNTTASSPMAESYDLDNERYVRFGENQTRVISVATPRASMEFGSSPGSPHAL